MKDCYVCCDGDGRRWGNVFVQIMPITYLNSDGEEAARHTSLNYWGEDRTEDMVDPGSQDEITYEAL